MKVDAKTRLIALCFVCLALGILASFEINWHVLEYSDSERQEVLIWSIAVLMISLTLVFSVSSIISRLSEGWKRLAFVVIAIGGLVGAIIAFDSPRVTEFFWGIVLGVTIMSASIALPLYLYCWIRSGFQNGSSAPSTEHENKNQNP